MLRLQSRHALGMLFFKTGDFCVKLINLIACIWSQTLDLVLEILNFFLESLNGRFKLILRIFCVSASIF